MAARGCNGSGRGGGPPPRPLRGLARECQSMVTVCWIEPDISM